jgi:hypothetical protein
VDVDRRSSTIDQAAAAVAAFGGAVWLVGWIRLRWPSESVNYTKWT